MKQKAEESEEFQEAGFGISRSLFSVEVFGTERTIECYDVNLQEGCDRRWVPDIPYVTVYWLYSCKECKYGWGFSKQYHVCRNLKIIKYFCYDLEVK
jgi:hypothetical protein